MVVLRIVDNSLSTRFIFYVYDLPGMKNAPRTLGHMTITDYHVCRSSRMVEVVSSQDGSNSKSHVDKSTFVFGVSVSADFHREVIQPMVVRPVLSESAEEDPNKDEVVAAVKSGKNVLSAVDLIVHVNLIYEVSHPLQTNNVEHRERLYYSIRTHGLEHIHGLAVTKPWDLIPNNGQDLTQLLDNTTYGHSVSRQNVRVSSGGDSHSFAALKKLSEMGEPYR